MEKDAVEYMGCVLETEAVEHRWWAGFPRGSQELPKGVAKASGSQGLPRRLPGPPRPRRGRTAAEREKKRRAGRAGKKKGQREQKKGKGRTGKRDGERGKKRRSRRCRSSKYSCRGDEGPPVRARADNVRGPLGTLLGASWEPWRASWGHLMLHRSKRRAASIKVPPSQAEQLPLGPLLGRS